MLWFPIHTYNTSSSQTQGLNFFIFCHRKYGFGIEANGDNGGRYPADGDGE